MMAPPPSGQSGPLSADDLATLAAVRKRARKVNRAAGIATMSGWTMAIFAGITLIAVIFGDIVALVLGVLLSALAWNEIQGGLQLRRLDRRGPKRLALNQVALGVLIVAYAAYSLVTSLNSPALANVSQQSGDPSTDAMLRDITYMVTYGLYGTLAIVGVVVPGLTAMYYFSRRRHIDRLIAESPSWAVEAVRIAA